MKKILTICLCLFIIACASKKTPIIDSPAVNNTNPSKSDYVLPTTITQENFKQTDPNFYYADFAKGKALYESKCNKCHDLKPVFSQDEEGWNRLVPNMVAKYNNKYPDMLDARAEELLLGFLKAELRQGR